MFVKILVFVKILSEVTRKEGRKEGKFQSLEVRASISHLKNHGKYSTFKFCLDQIGGWHTDDTDLISEGAKGD